MSTVHIVEPIFCVARIPIIRIDKQSTARGGEGTLGTAERRNAILKVLCRRRHETIGNLACEFGVSERTIRRDIDALSQTEPIYTQTGRYAGGVYVIDGYSIDRMYMTDPETQVLNKVLDLAQKQENFMSDKELIILKNIISTYTKPSKVRVHK